ncbi:HNH endonuclease [Streptomyces triticiradicis]|nr:HNH endonuclease signature motif containing protein [Streptomyces triticiradicis]
MLPIDADEPHDEQRAPDGTLWWELSFWPGTKRDFGQEPKLGAWLWFHKEVSETFTMRELRTALGSEIAGESEQLNRRLRKLREFEWIILSYKDDRTLPQDTYRLEAKGRRLWLRKERKGSQDTPRPSQRTRRIVLDRDDSRCKVCGVGGGESYPGESNSKAKLTIGHRVPQERLRSRGAVDDIDNWRTECARCNETVRNELPDPEQYDEVAAEIKQLRKTDLEMLLSWLRTGERSRSKLDRAHDRARKLPHSENEKLIDYIEKLLGRN